MSSPTAVKRSRLGDKQKQCYSCLPSHPRHATASCNLLVDITLLKMLFRTRSGENPLVAFTSPTDPLCYVLFNNIITGMSFLHNEPRIAMSSWHWPCVTFCTTKHQKSLEVLFVSARITLQRAAVEHTTKLM